MKGRARQDEEKRERECVCERERARRVDKRDRGPNERKSQNEI